MRFTSSQTSFKAGRLSPKLYQRIDSAQYKDGASVMVGARPMIDGGVDRLKGYRYLPDASEIIPNSVIDDYDIRLISMVVQRTPLIAILKREKATNEVTINFMVYPYTIGLLSPQDVWHPIIVVNGDVVYDVDEFDWAVVDDKMYLTHHRGDMLPMVVGFSSDLTEFYTYQYRDANSFFTILTESANTAIGGNLSISWAGINVPFIYPMTDIVAGANITVTALSSGTISATCVGNPAVIELLQKRSTIYLEQLCGKNFGDGNTRSVVGAGFYTNTGPITNGAKFAPLYVWGSTNKDVFDYLGTQTKVSSMATSEWYEGNWPKTVTNSDGRLVFGGCKFKPMTIYGSKVSSPNILCHHRWPDSLSEYLTYPTPFGNTVATDPYKFTVAAKEDSEITFIRTSSELIVGTDKRENVATGGDAILSALSISVRPKTANGSIPVKTASSGESVYYISSAGKQLYKFKDNSSNGSFVSQELSLLFSDLLDEDRIAQVEWMGNISTIMIRMESGALYGIVDDDQTSMNAFFDTGITGVLSMCSVVSRDIEVTGALGDHLLFFKEGLGMCSFEQLIYENGAVAPNVALDVSEKNAYLYYDRASSMYNTGPEFWVWGGQDIDTSGFTPAECIPISKDVYGGETVYIVNLSTFYTITANIPVGTGFHLLPTDEGIWGPYYHILIGIAPRPFQIATMPIEAGQQWGSAQMGIKNIDTLGIRHYKSYSYEVSSDGVSWEEVVVADDEGNCTTGRKEKKFSSSPKYDQIVYLRNTKAEPCTILGINMRGVSNDG